MARNYCHFGRFSTDSTAGQNAFYYKAPYVVAGDIAAKDALNVARATLESRIAVQLESRPHNYFETSDIWAAEARRVILADLPKYAWLHIRGTVDLLIGHHGGEVMRLSNMPFRPLRSMGGDMTSGRMPDSRTAAVLAICSFELVANVAMWLGCTWATLKVAYARVLRHRLPLDKEFVLLAAMVLGTIGLAGPQGLARVRIPIVPMAAMMASAIIYWRRLSANDEVHIEHDAQTLGAQPDGSSFKAP